MDNFLLGVASSAVASIIIGFFWPPFKNLGYDCINYLYFKFSPYAIDISGDWEGHFKEPDSDGKLYDSIELCRITQKGAYIQGIGIVNDQYSRQFTYSGRIIQDIFIGSNHRIGEPKGSVSGTGNYEFKISPDRKTMVGKCLWFDKDTSAVESSNYVWNKKIEKCDSI